MQKSDHACRWEECNEGCSPSKCKCNNKELSSSIKSFVSFLKSPFWCRGSGSIVKSSKCYWVGSAVEEKNAGSSIEEKSVVLLCLRMWLDPRFRSGLWIRVTQLTIEVAIYNADVGKAEECYTWGCHRCGGRWLVIDDSRFTSYLCSNLHFLCGLCEFLFLF